MAEKTYSEQLKDLQTAGYVTSSDTQNNSILIIESGSDVINPLPVSMIKTKYDINEISKAVDTNITELLPFVEVEQPDVVPRPLYNDRLADIARLQNEAIILENEIEAKIDIINLLLQDSASLVSENTSLRIETAFFKEQYTKSIEDINNLATDLGNSISDAIELKIVNLGCKAENAGLEAERNSLKSQVETLTSQLEGIQSVITAGGELSGQLSVGIIPDEEFIGVSKYKSRPYPWRNQPVSGGSAIITTSAKNYTIKNASTDKVTLNIKKAGNDPNIVEVAVQGASASVNTSGVTRTLESGQEIVLIVEVSDSGTRHLWGGNNNKPKDYTSEVLILVTSADEQLTEDLIIKCKVTRVRTK